MFQKPFCVVEFQIFPPNPQGVHIIITVLTLFTFTIFFALLEAPGDLVTLNWPKLIIPNAKIKT